MPKYEIKSYSLSLDINGSLIPYGYSVMSLSTTDSNCFCPTPPLCFHSWAFGDWYRFSFYLYSHIYNYYYLFNYNVIPKTIITNSLNSIHRKFTLPTNKNKIVSMLHCVVVFHIVLNLFIKDH